jgi:hypothetical protein
LAQITAYEVVEIMKSRLHLSAVRLYTFVNTLQACFKEHAERGKG